METFATPYQLYFHDGEQEHEKGAIGIHSVLSFKRFQAIISQKTGVPATQLSSVFVCRRTVGDSDKRQKLPINENTNFNIILNQHNPSKEKDCHFLVVLKKSKKERKAPRRRSIEIDNNDDEDPQSPDTKTKPHNLPSEASSPGTAESSPAPSPMLSPSPSAKQLYPQASPTPNGMKATALTNGTKPSEAKGTDKFGGAARVEPSNTKAVLNSPAKSSWQNGSTLQRISGFSVASPQKVESHAHAASQTNLKQSTAPQTSPLRQGPAPSAHEQDSRQKNRLRGSLLQQFNAEKMRETKPLAVSTRPESNANQQTGEERGPTLDEKTTNPPSVAFKSSVLPATEYKTAAAVTSKPEGITITESTLSKSLVSSETVPSSVSVKSSSGAASVLVVPANDTTKLNTQMGVPSLHQESLVDSSPIPNSQFKPPLSAPNESAGQPNGNAPDPHVSSTTNAANPTPPFASSAPTYSHLSRGNTAFVSDDNNNMSANVSTAALNGSVNTNTKANQFSVTVTSPSVHVQPMFQQQQHPLQQPQPQQQVQTPQYIHFNGIGLHYHHQQQPQQQSQQNRQEFSSPYFSFSAPEISGFSGMMNGFSEKNARISNSPSVCKLCFLCRERNIPTPPFHCCVDDRVIVGSKGPSPAGPIGRPGKRHVEAAA